MKRRSEQGVALVVTLILLSVITFMAVAFLAISRHEREGVINRSHQNDSVFAANAAIEHVKARLMSDMIVRNNGFDFGLLVSTNWINTNGYIPGLASLTNVNYDFIAVSHAPLGGDNQRQNIANLQILPRPPVFFSTNNSRLLETFTDFRFYLDYNRNGKFDTNGWIEPYFGLTPPPPGSRPWIFAKGDPEWIGILDRPELPHSRSNLFIARYAFIALPIGQTMDINYIHNVANSVNTGTPDQGFRRDQGVGSWEINLAGFLNAINPTIWGTAPTYSYDPINNGTPVGLGFQDAANIVAYRFNNNFNNMLTFASMYPSANPVTMQSDFMDTYSLGFLSTNTGSLPLGDPDNGLLGKKWSGSENTNWFFTPQDFFKVGVGNVNSFSNRLYSMGLPGVNSDTTNQYAFYKMLEQLGVDSFPESGKINVNYANRNGQSATNFQNWAPVEFFTNAANAMLATLKSEPGYTNLSTSYIPIYPTNAYTPAVHRLLQVAANIYDATTNRDFVPTTVVAPNVQKPYYPSVFKPVLALTNGGEIYIKGYIEVGTQSNLYISKPFDLSDRSATNIAALQAAISSRPNEVNVYGIPYVIGAKKGFPNFNEFSMGIVMQLTRRMQLIKQSQADDYTKWDYRTQYAVGVSNVFGVEMWNSYTNPYPRAVSILVTNDLAMTLTNNLGVMAQTNVGVGGSVVIGPNVWPGAVNLANPKSSFSIPLLTNFVFVPNSVLRYSPLGLATNVSSTADFEKNTGVGSQYWGMSATNRIRVMMIDSTGRLLDYVQLDGLDDQRDITRDLQKPVSAADPTAASSAIWDPNPQAGVPRITRGMWNQIQISLGSAPVARTEWDKYMLNPPNSTAQSREIASFLAFYIGTTNLLKVQTPFVPTGQLLDYRTWQANDPLVHYVTWDLNSVPVNITEARRVPMSVTLTVSNTLPNIMDLNDRYSPWGGNPKKAGDNNTHASDVAFKDPLVLRSDHWQFPTNKFPSVGWLGRVHRGTPWQTIYLKSPGILTNQYGDWEKWTGNQYKNTIIVQQGIADAPLTQPTNDWKIVDLFTAAVNDTATRGQLSINQTNAPSWHAVLDGVIALTNALADGDLDTVAPKPLVYSPFVVDPNLHNLAISNILVAINDVRRTNYMGGVFTNLGNLLAVPELSVNSPFLNHSTVQSSSGLSDVAYENIPQQILGLLKVGQPQYVVYAYGQSLKPADRSLYQGGGPYFGLCTNYTVTGESLIRAVIHVENPPIPGQVQLAQPRVVVDQYNVMPPE